jgi:bifunctional DNase/RNase
MPRLFTAALFTLTAAPSWAVDDVTFPVSIPSECMALAQREHVPIVLENKVEAVRVKVKLARKIATRWSRNANRQS